MNVVGPVVVLTAPANLINSPPEFDQMETKFLSRLPHDNTRLDAAVCTIIRWSNLYRITSAWSIAGYCLKEDT